MAFSFSCFIKENSSNVTLKLDEGFDFELKGNNFWDGDDDSVMDKGDTAGAGRVAGRRGVTGDDDSVIDKGDTAGRGVTGRRYGEEVGIAAISSKMALILSVKMNAKIL